MFQDLFFIPYTQEDADREEKEEENNLLRSVHTLQSISEDINLQLNVCKDKLDTVDKEITSVSTAVDSTIQELHATKDNHKLQVALSTACSVVGAGVCSVPFIPLLGAYSVITGTIGAVSGGILAWNFT